MASWRRSRCFGLARAGRAATTETGWRAGSAGRESEPTQPGTTRPAVPTDLPASCQCPRRNPACCGPSAEVLRVEADVPDRLVDLPQLANREHLPAETHRHGCMLQQPAGTIKRLLQDLGVVESEPIGIPPQRRLHSIQSARCASLPAMACGRSGAIARNAVVTTRPLGSRPGREQVCTWLGSPHNQQHVQPVLTDGEYNDVGCWQCSDPGTPEWARQDPDSRPAQQPAPQR